MQFLFLYGAAAVRGEDQRFERLQRPDAHGLFHRGARRTAHHRLHIGPFGRVKLLVAGALICAVACALYGVTTAILLLLAFRVINGLGFGMFSTNSGAAVADVIPKSRMSEGLGYYNLYSTLATAVGPYIALTIVAGGELQSFKKLFFIASGLCLMSMVSSSFVSYERRAKKAKESADASAEPEKAPETVANMPAKPLPKALFGFEYVVFLPVVVLTLMNFASSSDNTFLTLFAQDRALGNIGAFFTVNAVGLLVSRLLFGRVADRRGPDIIVIPGIAVLAVCYALIPLIHTSIWLFVLALPIGLASGGIVPCINALLFRRCSPQRRGMASAAFFSALDIGFAIGGSVFGFVADGLGFNWLYWFAAVLTVLACLIYIKFVSEKKYSARRMENMA
jgi:MFS family permease